MKSLLKSFYQIFYQTFCQTFRQSVVLLCLMLAVAGLLIRPVTAVSLTDTRVTQLEFQVRSLQTQINQLQSQSPGLDNSPSRSIITAAPDSFGTPGNPSLAEQFDNLAILVIELNQRVRALEDQLPEPTQ